MSDRPAFNRPALLMLKRALIESKYFGRILGIDSPEAPIFDMGVIFETGAERGGDDDCKSACCAFGLGLITPAVVELTSIDLYRWNRGKLEYIELAMEAYGLTKLEASELFAPCTYWRENAQGLRTHLAAQDITEDMVIERIDKLIAKVDADQDRDILF